MDQRASDGIGMLANSPTERFKASPTKPFAETAPAEITTGTTKP